MHLKNEESLLQNTSRFLECVYLCQPAYSGSSQAVMIFGGVGSAHTTKNHYLHTTTLIALPNS